MSAVAADPGRPPPVGRTTRHHLPPAVLEPTFAELAGQGMIVRDADSLDLT